MSKHSILKRWLTNIPFGVFLVSVMMLFALAASSDVWAEGAFDEFELAPTEVEKYGYVWDSNLLTEHDETIETIQRIYMSLEKAIASTANTEQTKHILEGIGILTEAVVYAAQLMQATKSANVIMDTYECRVKPTPREEDTFKLDPNLGCITDMECEIEGITYRES